MADGSIAPDQACSKSTARMRRWRAANPDKARAANIRAARRNVAKRYESTRRWRNRNRTRIRAYDASRIEIIRAQKRTRYARNPNYRAYASAWKKAHPEYSRSAKHARRARQYSAPGKHTVVEREALLRKQRHRCANPHCRADLRIVRKALDHIVALVNGGTNFITNCQWLCRPCNSRKTVLSQSVWLAREALR